LRTNKNFKEIKFTYTYYCLQIDCLQALLLKNIYKIKLKLHKKVICIFKAESLYFIFYILYFRAKKFDLKGNLYFKAESSICGQSSCRQQIISVSNRAIDSIIHVAKYDFVSKTFTCA